MDWIFAVLTGALIGWTVAVSARLDRHTEAVSAVMIGVVGFVFGRGMFGALYSDVTPEMKDVFGLFCNLFGAGLMLFLSRSIRFLI